MLLIRSKPSEDDILPPHLPDKLHVTTCRTTSFGGLTRADEADAGCICGMNDMSPASYPAIRTRSKRCLYTAAPGTGAAHGAALHGDRVIIAQGTGLYEAIEGQPVTNVGTLADSDKTIISFGDDLLVLPDGYAKRAGADTCTPVNVTTGPLESAAIMDNLLLVANYDFIGAGFAAGDGIYVEVLGGRSTAYISGYYKIEALSEGTLRVRGRFPGNATETVRISRTMPDLVGACVVGDRVYGFKDNEVYVCEAGNPFNWYAADPDAPENAPVSFRTGTDTPFTACIAWQGYPTFFKRDRICRLVGRSVGYTSDTAKTSSLALSDLPAPGVGDGMARTLCEIGGALYYCADQGIYRYAGSYPVRIDDDLWPEAEPVCGGTDGRSYYLSCVVGGEEKLLVYRPESDVGSGWYAESAAGAVFMTGRSFRLPGSHAAVCLYQTVDGGVRMTSSCGSPGGEYTVDAGDAVSPFVEFGDELDCMPAESRLLAVTLRAEGAAGTVMRVKCRWEGDPVWVTIGTLIGSGETSLYRIPVLPRPAGWFRLRCEMTGGWTIRGLWREIENNR